MLRIEVAAQDEGESETVAQYQGHIERIKQTVQSSLPRQARLHQNEAEARGTLELE